MPAAAKGHANREHDERQQATQAHQDN